MNLLEWMDQQEIADDLALHRERKLREAVRKIDAEMERKVAVGEYYRCQCGVIGCWDVPTCELCGRETPGYQENWA